MNEPKKSRLMLLGLTLFLIALASFIQPQRVSLSTKDFLDSNLPSQQKYKDHLDLFPGHQELIVVAQKKDRSTWDPPSQCSLFRQLKRSFRELGSTNQFYNLYEARTPQIKDGRFFYYKAFNDNCIGSHPAESLFLSKDRRTQLYSFDLKFDPHPIYGEFHPDQLQEALTALTDAAKDFDLQFTGNVQFQNTMRAAIDQSFFINAIFAGLLTFCFLLLFKSWKATIIFLGTLTFATIPLFFLMTIWDVPVDPLMTCLLMVISLATLEDFLLLSTQRALTGSSLNQLFQQFKRPSFLTSLTTTIGFGPLIFSEISSLQYFGMLVCLGVLLEWGATFYILPIFFTAFPSWSHWVQTTPALNLLKQVSLYTPPRWTIYPGLMILIASLLAIAHVNVDHSPLKLLDAQSPFMRATESVTDLKNGEGQLEVVFSSHDSEEQRVTIIDSIKKIPKVRQIESIRDLINVAKIPADLDEMVRRELVSSNIGSRFFSTDRLSERVFVTVERSSTSLVSKIESQIQKICKTSCSVEGELVAFSGYTNAIIEVLSHGAVWTLLIVIAMIYLLMKLFQLRAASRFAFSAAWGPLATIGIVALTQFPINLTTVVLGAVAIGLAGDNAIQFTFLSKNAGLREGPKQLAVASLVCMFTMSIASLSFLFSNLPNIRQLGIYLICLFLLGFIGDVFLLRSSLTDKE